MINKNKLKKILLLLLAISTITLNYKKVYAFGGYGSDSSSSGDDGPHSTAADSRTPKYGSACDSVRCGYSNFWEKETNIQVEMKSMDGQLSQTDIFGTTVKNEFLAGTYVMLKVYQTQYFNSSSSYFVSAKRQVWTCRHYEWEDITVCVEPGPLDTCEETGTTKVKVLRDVYEKDCACNGDDEATFKGWRDVTAEYIDSCAAGAVPRSFDLEAIVEAKYNDSNNIENNSQTTVLGHECSKPIKGKGPEKTDANGTHTGSNTLSGECAISYDREADICINAKNGEVRYLDGQTKGKCEEDEYKLTKTEDGYWKYFIPLNANSANDFSFKLKSSGATEIAEICDDIKSKYPNWEKGIKMNADGTCSYETTVTIPVAQRFYNELEDGKTFKGFNFYYKPIDINDPFPNGLTDTSIWYDWNQGNSSEPNISESFNKVTYFASTSGNENSIRNYTKDNTYTSWENMNIDGTSDFIKNQGIVTGYDDSFYRLGCGPKNTNVNNTFAQAECDRK